MRLAAMFRRPERELMDSLGSDELLDWLAFASLYDLPDEFFAAGQVCTVLARVFGNDATPDDFVPYFRQPKRPLTPDQIRAKFAGMRQVLDARRNP